MKQEALGARVPVQAAPPVGAVLRVKSPVMVGGGDGDGGGGEVGEGEEGGRAGAVDGDGAEVVA